jgi:glycosyltransferase involved in cell wall biosynthesis
MIDNLFNKEFLPLTVFILFGFVFILQMGYYWLLFSRLVRFKGLTDTPGPPHRKQPVTVVICAHNACHQLKENLPYILEQDYPEFEVLVVNHSSDDDTQYLLNNLEERYPHLTAITIHEDLNFFSGKKFPLSIGIKSAKHNLVLLTDADCKPVSNQWIDKMQSAYLPKTEVVLGFGPYIRRKGLLNKLIRFDTAHIAIQYLSFALAGIPYMGVGRNLSYKKQLFFKNNGFISHYRIRSGDDDLFINRVAKASNTAIMIHPGSFTVSEPKATLGQWITQKRRHLSTSVHYKPIHKYLLGVYSFSTFSFYALFVLLLSLGWSWIPVLLLVFLRLTSLIIVFTKCLRRLNEKDFILFVPFFEVLMMALNIGMATANFFKKPTRWK